MIKITNVKSFLGDGVYDMVHTSCDCDPKREFIVNTGKWPVHYNPLSGLVECPWCDTGVALSVILENHEKETQKTA